MMPRIGLASAQADRNGARRLTHEQRAGRHQVSFAVVKVGRINPQGARQEIMQFLAVVEIERPQTRTGRESDRYRILRQKRADNREVVQQIRLTATQEGDAVSDSMGKSNIHDFAAGGAARSPGIKIDRRGVTARRPKIRLKARYRRPERGSPKSDRGRLGSRSKTESVDHCEHGLGVG